MSDDNQNEHGYLYKFANAVHDILPEDVQKSLRSTGVTGTLQATLDGADSVAGSDVMTKYGYAGLLTLTYLSVFRGWDYKMAGVVSGIVAATFGQFVEPTLRSFFNSASNPNQPTPQPAPQAVTTGFVAPQP